METLASIYNPSDAPVTGAGGQVESTAPQSDWTGATMRDYGFRDQATNGVIGLPERIRVSDVQFQGYDPYGEGSGDYVSPRFASLSLGEGYQHWSGANDQAKNYAISPIGAGDWIRDQGYQWDPNTGFQLKVKSGDKVGSTINYKREGDYFVPDLGSRNMERWDTNDAKQNAAIAKMIMTAVSMGTMGPAMEGLGSALQAGTMPTLGQIGSGLNFANTFTGGQVPGLNLLAPIAGGLGNIGNVVSGGVDSLQDIAKLAGSGYNVYNKGQQLMNMFSGPDEQAGTGYQPRTPYNVSQPSTGFNIGDLGRLIFGGQGSGQTGIMDMYGAYRGSQEARDEAFRLQNLFNDAQARRQPVLDRLNASYTDPNTFYDSNQWKGLSSVYQNQIDRGAASKGRMANPTDREVLLNNYAMKELENYRAGLRQQAQLLNPDAYLNPFMRGSTREAGALNPYFAMGARGSVGAPGGGAMDSFATLTKLAQSFGGFDKIPSFLRNMFDSSNPNYGSPPGGFESDFPPQGPAVIDDTSSFDPSVFGGWSDDPFTFNPDGGNGFGFGDFDVEDTSWIDELFGGF